MTGAGALCKVLDTAFRPSCSLIPHIRAHIGARQRTTRTTPSNAATSEPQSRHGRAVARNVSTATENRRFFDLSGPFAQAERGPAKCTESSATTTGVADTDTSDDRKSLAATVKVEELLEEGHPDRMLYALTSSHDSTNFIRNATDEDFTRALRTLDPQWFLESYKPIYRRMSRALHFGPLYRTVRSLEDRFDVFASCLKSIMSQRRAAGHRLTNEAYKHILKCAEAMGDGELARVVFEDLMPEDCTEQTARAPDLECYNSTIAATAWFGAFEAVERTYNRRNHQNITLREDRLELKGSRPYSALREARPSRPTTSSIREYAMDLFRRINEAELAPNEKTFTGLMVALGQEGDMHAVNSILRSVWNIDIDLLSLHGEDEIQSPTYYEPTSPLCPTRDLLRTLVFVFANNNQVVSATILMDFVSRNYNIAITRDIWMMLFETTFEFSSIQWGRKKDTTGQLDSLALDRLYETMTDIPHEVSPDASVMAMLATNASRRLSHDKALAYLREANRLLDVEKTELSLLYDQVLDQVRKHSNSQKSFLTTEFLNLRRKYIAQSLTTDMALQEVIIAVRRVLQQREPRKRRWIGDGDGDGDGDGNGNGMWRLAEAKDNIAPRYEFFTRFIPNLIREFDTKLPNQLRYQVQSGTVEIENGYLHRAEAIELADGHFADRSGIVRQALDTDHHDYMAACLSNLEWKLHHSQNGFCPMCKEQGHGQKDCPSKDLLLAGHLQSSDLTPSHHAVGSEETKVHRAPGLFEDTHQHEANKTGRKRSASSPSNTRKTSISDSVSPAKFTFVTPAGQENHRANLAERWSRQRSPGGTYRGKTPDPTRPLVEQQGLLKGTSLWWLRRRGLTYTEANPKRRDSSSDGLLVG